MSVLVTGGLGYICSHTCVELMNAGQDDENTIFLQPCFLITSSKTSVPVTLLSKYSSGL